MTARPKPLLTSAQINFLWDTHRKVWYVQLLGDGHRGRLRLVSSLPAQTTIALDDAVLLELGRGLVRQLESLLPF